MWRCLSLVFRFFQGLVFSICSFIFKYSYFLQLFTWPINTGVHLIGEKVVVFFFLRGGCGSVL